MIILKQINIITYSRKMELILEEHGIFIDPTLRLETLDTKVELNYPESLLAETLQIQKEQQMLVGQDVYRIEFVSDPHDPMVKEDLSLLLSYVSTLNIDVINTSIYKSYNKYQFNFLLSKQNSKIDVNKIYDLVSKVSYVPVSYSMNLTPYITYDNISDIISGAESMVRVVTSEVLSVDISYVSHINLENNIINFYPHTSDYVTSQDSDNNSVWTNSKYMGMILALCDLDYLAQYQVLSTHPLTRYVIESWLTPNEEGYQEYQQSDLPVIWLDTSTINGKGNSISLIKVDNVIIGPQKYEDIKNRLNTYIDGLVLDGYFTYDYSIYNLEDMEIVKTVTDLWNIDYVYDEDLTNVVLKSNTDYYLSVKEWLYLAVTNVKQGTYPNYTLSGEWQYWFSNDFNRMFGEQDKRYIIKYLALLAYRDLALSHTYLRPATTLTTVNPDYSVTISIPTLKLAQEFRQKLKRLLAQKEYINVSPVKSIEEGIIKRWYVQSIDEKALPLILSTDKDTDLLIFRSPLVVNYPDPFQLNNTNAVNNAKEDLIRNLKYHYKGCYDLGPKQFDPLYRDHIDNLSLEQLMDIIPVFRHGREYCLSSQSVRTGINPITAAPLDDSLIAKANSYNQGLRGLFSVGNPNKPLIGLYSDAPVMEYVKVDIGTIKIISIAQREPQKRFTPERYSVQVDYEDSTLTQLFEITLDNSNYLSSLQTVVSDLWSKGFFLNMWWSYYYSYYSHIKNNDKSFPVIVTDLTLLKAASSTFDGYTALKYMLRQNF